MGHTGKICYYKEWQCRRCKNKGHLMRVCPQRKQNFNRHVKNIHSLREHRNEIEQVNDGDHVSRHSIEEVVLQGRRLRTRLDLLKPNIMNNVEINQRKQVKYAGGSERLFVVGERVWVRDFGRNADPYVRGVIMEGLFHTNVRWGPGIQSHACLKEDVGLWDGLRLVRLTWRPEGPSVAPDFSATNPGRTLLESKRVKLRTRIKEIEERNSSNDFLTLYGITSEAATEMWQQLYPKNCTDFMSPLCPTEDYEFNFYNGSVQLLEELRGAPEHIQTTAQPSENQSKMMTYFSWSNNKNIVHMMQHSYTHDNQRSNIGINLAQVLSGPRSNFMPAGKHEINCRNLLMESFLGNVQNVVALINEQGVHPNVADGLGNSSIMYAACGDSREVLHFLSEAGANVNSFNDSCCTPLAVALLRLTCALNNISPNKMINASLPLVVPTSLGLSEEKTVEWNMEKHHIALFSNDLKKVTSRTLKSTSTKKLKSTHKSHNKYYTFFGCFSSQHIMQTILQLLADGANPQLVNFPKPALYMAIISGNEELVKHLVNFGADINQVYYDTFEYTPLDLAISQPFTKNNLNMVRIVLECGAKPNRRLKVFSDDLITDECLGPTLLHAVLARKTANFMEDEVQKSLLELLLDFNFDPVAKYNGCSAIEIAMSINLSLLDVFIKNHLTNLNSIINSDNQTILVKMFSIEFFKTVTSTERLKILTNLLAFGADPLMQCTNTNETFANLFVYAKETLTEMENSHSKPIHATAAKKIETKKGEKSKNDQIPAKSTLDDKDEYKEMINFVLDCARTLHMRWLRSKLTKELIKVIAKYKHRHWNMIIKEHNNKCSAKLWLTASHCLEIWDILKTTKRVVYNDSRILKHLLCLVMNITSSTSASNVQLPFNEKKILCPFCEVVSFCGFECIKINIDRTDCHPCSDMLKDKYFPNSPSIDYLN
ncbi:hypothetical protein ACJJTC_012638 [Scirpophaga incertulas]